MSFSIGKECGECGRYYKSKISENCEVRCSHCGKEAADIPDVHEVFNACPFCQTKQFYRRKDFNQLLGCSFVLVGALLVPFTYGLSLPFLILIDWLIYRHVSDMAVCYSCGVEFRDITLIPEKIIGFDHHTAELYE
jgi:DNA-directed RNA polymerase subunit RPC12/RpoP